MRFLFLVLMLTSSISLAVERTPQYISPCSVFLSGDDVVKTSEGALPEIKALVNRRYEDLHVGLAWGKNALILPLKLRAKMYEINRDTLPTVPKLSENSSLNLVIGMRGRLKEPSTDRSDSLNVASVVFALTAERSRANSFYQLSSSFNSVDRNLDEDNLILYLTALSAVPYANSLEIIYSVNESSSAKVRKSLLEGKSQSELGNQIAPSLIKALGNSAIFDSMSIRVAAFRSRRITRDLAQANSFQIIYRFVLRNREQGRSG